MAKPKRSASKGQMKKHGPKRKMFHDYNKCARAMFGSMGMLNKFNDKESFDLSCQAKGNKNATMEDWLAFLKSQN